MIRIIAVCTQEDGQRRVEFFFGRPQWSSQANAPSGQTIDPPQMRSFVRSFIVLLFFFQCENSDIAGSFVQVKRHHLTYSTQVKITNLREEDWLFQLLNEGLLRTYIQIACYMLNQSQTEWLVFHNTLYVSLETYYLIVRSTKRIISATTCSARRH